ncbi:MAG: MoaD/ThiS family protein [Deltaproteobacteria bacterium]|nr:MoaD/ThiS family protein [Deltaproteobacteria bacterium]
MKVELRLYASLARYMPKQKGSKLLDVREGTTLRGLLEQLDVPLRSVKILFLNGVHAEGNEPLKDGDRVGVFPPVAGG